MAKRTKAEAAETRERVLEAALDLFSKKGYGRTTFVDIARQIGLTKGAVYWHFKTKTDLLVALIDHGCARKCLRLDSLGEMPETLAALRDCYVESARTVLKDPGMRKFEFFLNFQIEWSEKLIAEVRTRLSELREDPVRKYTRAIERLQEAGAVDRATDAGRMASLLMATWVGLLRLALIGLIGQKDFPDRAGHGFDLMFRESANKEQGS